MLYVRVELWPHGNRDAAKVIGESYIANDGTGTSERGNYNFRILGKGGRTLKTKVDRVIDFPRQSYHVWHLLKRILNAAF